MFDFVQPPFAPFAPLNPITTARTGAEAQQPPARNVVDPCDPVKLCRGPRWCYPPFSTFEWPPAGSHWGCGNKMAVSQAGVCTTTHVASFQIASAREQP